MSGATTFWRIAGMSYLQVTSSDMIDPPFYHLRMPKTPPLIFEPAIFLYNRWRGQQQRLSVLVWSSQWKMLHWRAMLSTTHAKLQWVTARSKPVRKNTAIYHLMPKYPSHLSLQINRGSFIYVLTFSIISKYSEYDGIHSKIMPSVCKHPSWELWALDSVGINV